MTDTTDRWPWPFLRIAHRGAPAQARENSLDGFVLAMALGADMVETDLRLSLDGAIVLAHDDRLVLPGERGRPRPVVSIARTPLAVLRRLADDVPILDEALALRHHGAPLAFNLDLKVSRLADGLVRSLRRADRHGGIVLTGNAPRTFASVRSAEPWVQAALTRSARYRNAPARRSTFSVLIARGPQLGPRLVHAARAAGVTALTLEQTLATPETVHACHQAGLRVLVWTVDDPVRMHALRAAGVDGITTNRIDLLVTLQ